MEGLTLLQLPISSFTVQFTHSHVYYFSAIIMYGGVSADPFEGGVHRARFGEESVFDDVWLYSAQN